MSSTFLTRSGRALAFPSRLFFPSSTNILSVPAEMTLQRVLISTPPAPHAGAGTSASLTSPLRCDCKICFIPVHFYIPRSQPPQPTQPTLSLPRYRNDLGMPFTSTFLANWYQLSRIPA